MRRAVVVLLALIDWHTARRTSAIRIEHPDTHWQDQGFTELVGPLRPPTTLDEMDETEVWIKLPAHGVIRTRWVADQDRFFLSFPPGTLADRVERHGVLADGKLVWQVVDVRGTEFLDGGAESFHVARPARKDRLAPLVGVAWRRDDIEAQEEATERMIDLLRETVPAAAFDRAARRLRTTNECASCHSRDKSENRRADDPKPRRATDDSGMYSPLAVLSDRGPLETYRPHDPNVADPWMLLSCSGVGPLDVEHKKTGAVVRCRDGSIPLGELDIERGVVRGDARAEAVCRSRRFLFEHLDSVGREAFATSFDECGIS